MAEESIRRFADVALGFEILGGAVLFALYVGRLAGEQRHRRLRAWSAFFLNLLVYGLKVTVLSIPGWVTMIFLAAAAVGLWTLCRAQAWPERVAFLVLTYYCAETGGALIANNIFINLRFNI